MSVSADFTTYGIADIPWLRAEMAASAKAYSVAPKNPGAPIATITVVGAAYLDLEKGRGVDTQRTLGLMRYLARSGLPVAEDVTIRVANAILDGKNYLEGQDASDVTLICNVPMDGDMTGFMSAARETTRCVRKKHGLILEDHPAERMQALKDALAAKNYREADSIMYDHVWLRAAYNGPQEWKNRLGLAASKLTVSIITGAEVDLLRVAPPGHFFLGNSKEKTPTGLYDPTWLWDIHSVSGNRKEINAYWQIIGRADFVDVAWHHVSNSDTVLSRAIRAYSDADNDIEPIPAVSSRPQAGPRSGLNKRAINS